MTYLMKITSGLLFWVLLVHTNAASLSFDMAMYSGSAGSQVSVSIVYDFTNTPSWGGGFNVIYDADVLEFVSYIEAPGAGFGYHDPVWSPTGSLVSPGQYLNAGISAAGKTAFSYIQNTAVAGTFVFNVIGSGGDGGCGATLCLTPISFNPMVSLDGQDITEIVFANGTTEASVVVPVPAALWLMLGGLFALGSNRKRLNN